MNGTQIAKNLIIVRLQSEIFDPGGESNLFIEQADGAGAAVTFTGLVRSMANNPTEKMTLEHYPELAQSQLEKMGQEAVERFELLKVTIIHRYGAMYPSEPIVQVMTLSPHRQAAFDGANFIMDWLKTDAPFWKFEEGKNGATWVSAKTKDDEAKDKWK
jgi:molybdopterin synthase catalytic subunit